MLIELKQNKIYLIRLFFFYIPSQAMKNGRINGFKKVEGSKRNTMETTKIKNTPSPHSQ